MLGGMPFVIALLVAGILLFAVASTKNVSLLVFPSYFCYLAAGALFLANQLYTITNVIAAIDTTSFETPFVVAGAAIIVTIVTGLISTIPVQHK